MSKIDTLRRYGLFDARVPRYTSYPPANHFTEGAGQRHQQEWLQSVPDGTDVSLYIHIPFCKKLCWFCACRTQTAQSMPPVDAYVAVLRREILAVRARLPAGIRMSQLHIGGGTPTILPADTMAALLQEVLTAFTPAPGFEFAVEIDPTDAPTPLLQTLLDFGLTRASIGVQDFAPQVQDAIGRHQSLDQTRDVIGYLRAGGLRSLDLDVLYGLPHQTVDSFLQTLDHVLALAPDRLAIYGYAHVPWMSKRQVMINEADLPDSMARLDLSAHADDLFTAAGYLPVGIDHFALPTDSLADAARAGRLHRNFQGYTDDSCDVLLGLGASSISRFPQGYAQNASGTADYQRAVRGGDLATGRGHVFKDQDRLRARMIEALMCDFRVDTAELVRDFTVTAANLDALYTQAVNAFPGMVRTDANGLEILPEGKPLTRMIVRLFDAYDMHAAGHSSAI